MKPVTINRRMIYLSLLCEDSAVIIYMTINEGERRLETSEETKYLEGGGCDYLLINQTVLDGIAHQFCSRFHLHLFKDARAVGADGGRAEREFPGNLFDFFAAA